MRRLLALVVALYVTGGLCIASMLGLWWFYTWSPADVPSNVEAGSAYTFAVGFCLIVGGVFANLHRQDLVEKRRRAAAVEQHRQMIQAREEQERQRRDHRPVPKPPRMWP